MFTIQLIIETISIAKSATEERREEEEKGECMHVKRLKRDGWRGRKKEGESE